MGKANLVMDMPDSCSKCKFLYQFQGTMKCLLMNALNGRCSRVSQNNFTARRHEKCPLVSFPDTRKYINNLSKLEFTSYIMCEICDYAKENNYQITDTVAEIGKIVVAAAEFYDLDEKFGK